MVLNDNLLSVSNESLRVITRQLEPTPLPRSLRQSLLASVLLWDTIPPRFAERKVSLRHL
jgi:hypothetical protein